MHEKMAVARLDQRLRRRLGPHRSPKKGVAKRAKGGGPERMWWVGRGLCVRLRLACPWIGGSAPVPETANEGPSPAFSGVIART